MALNELAQEIHGISKSKGFWELEGEEVWDAGVFKTYRRDPLAVFMLIVSEVAEAAEKHREGADPGKASTVWEKVPGWGEHYSVEQINGVTYLTDIAGNKIEPPREMTPALWEQCGYIPKPGGIPEEMADIIIRVLDACAAWGIDIEEVIRHKIRYNSTRPYKHGKIA